MKFRKVYIEITNQCNLSCRFCPKTDREPLFMDEALFDAICGQLRGLARRLYLHVMGEPLLHPRLAAYLDICSFYGHGVNLITNGTLLAKRGGDLLEAPALRQLSVSLHSHAQEGSEEDLRAYLRDIRDFAARAAFRGDFIVQLRLWNKGADDPAVMLRSIRETFGLTAALKQRLNDRRSFMLGKNLCIDSVEPFEWPSLSGKDYGDKGTCLGLRKQCAILADGEVTACCLDNNGALGCGTVKERALTDILSGTRATAIRRGFEQGAIVEPLCRRCSYRLRFSPGSGLTPCQDA